MVRDLWLVLIVSCLVVEKNTPTPSHVGNLFHTSQDALCPVREEKLDFVPDPQLS